MGINNVSFDEAKVSKAAAGEYLRSKNVSIGEKTELAALYGEDFVKQALSVDSTKYEISDEDFNDAKQAGKDATKETVGYDGSKTYGAVVDAGASAVGAAGTGTFLIAQGGNITSRVTLDAAKATDKVHAVKGGAAKAGAYAAAIAAIAVALKYQVQKPNKEQYKAAMELYNPNGGGANVLGEANASLEEAQENIEDASQNVTELTETAEEKVEESNDKNENDKTLFDVYKMQYESLKAQKAAGVQLTPDQQAQLKSLAPMMKDLGEDINTTTEETNSEVKDINGNIAEYQDAFDESAETIAEVEGVTDYAEGFDENARTMMYVEGGSQALNAASGAIAGAKLFAGPWWQYALAGAAIIAAGRSTVAASEQFGHAKDVSAEIDTRKEVQEFGETTTELYDEELDNYAANVEIVEEDLELEVPEDMAVPEDTAAAAAPATTAAAEQKETEKVTDKKEEDEDKNKKKDDEIK